MHWKKAFWEGTMDDLIRAGLTTPLEDAEQEFVRSLRILREVSRQAEENPSPLDPRVDQALDAAQVALVAYRQAHDADRHQALKAGLPTAC